LSELDKSVSTRFSAIESLLTATNARVKALEKDVSLLATAHRHWSGSPSLSEHYFHNYDCSSSSGGYEGDSR
jgi:hypothetical protein